MSSQLCKYKFTPELLDLLNRDSQWPPVRSFRRFLNQQYDTGFKNDEYAMVKRGEDASKRLLPHILMFICSKNPSFPLRVGLGDWISRSIDDLGSHFIIEAIDSELSLDGERDELLRGPSGLAAALLGAASRLQQPAKSIDIAELATCFPIGIADHVAEPRILDRDQAEQVGLDELKLAKSQLEDLNGRWLEACPNSIFTFRDLSGNLLLSIALPLQTQAYHRLSCGEISEIDLHRQDVIPHSENVALLAVAGDTRVSTGAARRIAQRRLATMVLQQAARISNPIVHVGLNLISIDGTPQDARRLRKWGFKPLHADMPRVSKRLVELKIAEPS